MDSVPDHYQLYLNWMPSTCANNGNANTGSYFKNIANSPACTNPSTNYQQFFQIDHLVASKADGSLLKESDSCLSRSKFPYSATQAETHLAGLNSYWTDPWHPNTRSVPSSRSSSSSFWASEWHTYGRCVTGLSYSKWEWNGAYERAALNAFNSLHTIITPNGFLDPAVPSSGTWSQIHSSLVLPSTQVSSGYRIYPVCERVSHSQNSYRLTGGIACMDTTLGANVIDCPASIASTCGDSKSTIIVDKFPSNSYTYGAWQTERDQMSSPSSASSTSSSSALSQGALIGIISGVSVLVLLVLMMIIANIILRSRFKAAESKVNARANNDHTNSLDSIVLDNNNHTTNNGIATQQ